MKNVSRFLRKSTVLALILVWNTAGMYATVCSSLCEEAEYAQRASQASPARLAHATRVRMDAANGPASPDPYCVNNLQTRKCVIASFQGQRPEFVKVHRLVVTVTPVALGFTAGAVFRTHSPPSLSSGRSICNKLTLLRI